MPCRIIFAISVVFALAACNGDKSQSPPPTATSTPAPAASATTSSTADVPDKGLKRFHSIRLGFYIDYPADMASSVKFDSTYLANDAWKTYAPENSTGTSVLMLTLPDSDDVTAGELRIGISSGDQEVAQCDRPPSNADKNGVKTISINGTDFTGFHAADAAMNHYLKVHSYRVVHGGYCYAIDLLVTGTNPEVYDPPREPPFSNREAFAQLHKALQGFHFTR